MILVILGFLLMKCFVISALLNKISRGSTKNVRTNPKFEINRTQLGLTTRAIMGRVIEE